MSRHLDHRSTIEGDEDVSLDCLGHPTRRSILTLLQDQDVPIHLADLARDLAAKDAPTRDEGDATDPIDLYMMLYHCHIPKLADADLVRYDQERRTVTVTAASPHRETAAL